MDDREELRRLIDVIEKGSGSGSLEQAVDDIKTFANTASFLANKLDTRLKGGDVKPRSSQSHAWVKPSRQCPSPTRQQHQVRRLSRRLQIHPVCQRRRVHQRHRLTLSGLNHRGRNHPLGQVDRSGVCCRLCCGLRGRPVMVR